MLISELAVDEMLSVEGNGTKASGVIVGLTD